MITDNTSNKNGRDGIHSDTDSSTGNTFSGNIAEEGRPLRHRGPVDGQAPGAQRTRGRANTCKPMGDSNPSGLCAP